MMKRVSLKTKIEVGVFFFLLGAPAFAVGTLIVDALIKVALLVEGSFLAAAVKFAINFAVSTLVSRVFGKKPPKKTDNGVRQQVPPSSTNSIPVVYGDAWLGGTFVDAVLTTDQKTMFYVMTISNISSNGQFTFDKTKFYYGDRLVTFDSTDPAKVISLTDGQGNVDTKIDGNLWIYLYRSTDAGVITNLDNGGTSPGSGAPNTIMSLANGVPSGLEWPATNRQMNGLAFAIIKLVYSQEDDATSLQPVTFYAKHYLNGAGVAKPGDVWYDYLTNAKYGGAVDAAYVSSATATALNNYSDQLITFTDNTGNPSTQPRYRINGVLDTGTNVLENIDNILTACDSWMAYDAPTGQWSIVINKAETASLSFDDSNIIGDIRVSTIDITQALNQIEASFPNKLNKDIPAYVFIQTPAGLLYPNEPVNKYTTSFDLVNDSVQAQYLANRILEQAREDLLVTIKTTYYGIQANAGDVVGITNAAYGWSGKLFRVIKVNESSLPDGSLGAMLELSEYNAQVYDDKDITEYQPAPNTDIPSSNYFSALTAPTISDALPTAAVPSFSVDCVIPATGRVTTVYLYYTTVSTPTTLDWQLLGLQSSSDSQAFANGSTVKFTNVILPTGTYYFAFKVGNASGQSVLSPQSVGYAWSPNPTATAAGAFVALFSPPVLQVPYSTSPTFTGITPQLYGTVAGGAIDYVNAGADSDALFVNNSWRIGASSTTGLADIVKTNITIANPTDGGSYAIFPEPTAMSGNPATIDVPVRYKDSSGVVTQSANAICQLTFNYQGATGTAGDKTATVYLYQWATTTPSNPSGTSTYTWATGSNASYTGSGGWSTTVPANPGTPLIRLWTATKAITAAGSTVSTSVDWTSGYSIQALSQNGATGASGVQSATVMIYQWAITIPAGPTGTSTYTWSTGIFTPTPAGWTLTGGTAPSQGYTLWAAEVYLLDSATATTSSINWTTANIIQVGYAGTDGATGATGTTGASARICYTKTTLSSLNTTPLTITTSGSTSFPPNGSWGAGTVWQATAPTIVAGESVYQSDGIYSPTTGNTVWNVPYLSNLKVGSLSAITVNTGNLTVTGSINTSTTGNIRGGQTDYNTGIGYFLGYSSAAYKFSIGDPAGDSLLWDGSSLTVTGQGTFVDLVSYPLNKAEIGIDVTGSLLRMTVQNNTTSPPAYLIDQQRQANNSLYILRNGNPVGYSYVAVCDLATTANITLSGVRTVDGIPTSNGERVLVKNQTTTSQNGIYVTSSTGAWARATDADVWSEFYFPDGTRQIVTIAVGGATNSRKQFYFSGATTGTVGVTAIAYTELDYINSTYSGAAFSANPFGYTAIAATDTTIYANTRLVTINGCRREAQLGVTGRQIVVPNGTDSVANHAARFYYVDKTSTVISSAIAGYSGTPTFAFYADIGGYGPFTGAHDGLMLKTETAQQGDIVVDVQLLGKSSVSNTIFEVTKSTAPNTSALGIYVDSEELDVTDPPAALIESAKQVEVVVDGQTTYEIVLTTNPLTNQYAQTYNVANINGVGEGQVNVCGENGNIQPGDLIVTSSMPGKGMKQADDIVRSITVAKAREGATFSSPTEVKMIACTYLCG